MSGVLRHVRKYHCDFICDLSAHIIGQIPDMGADGIDDITVALGSVDIDNRGC